MSNPWTLARLGKVLGFWETCESGFFQPCGFLLKGTAPEDPFRLDQVSNLGIFLPVDMWVLSQHPPHDGLCLMPSVWPGCLTLAPSLRIPSSSG